jgi:phenylpropionate dioxygenase-like ring-hydroxylating dioxygenase large terminal subunit
MTTMRPGEFIDSGPLISEIDFSEVNLKLSTDRYRSREYHERERKRLWMKVWQIAGRADELPQKGDWKTYQLFDQSFLIVRGKDNHIRGFVNACRHRGNQLCRGKGSAARFTCPYHKWSYGLDGQILAVSRPDFNGTIEDFVGPKDSLGLVEVPVECFAGFIFLNPDRDAPPLEDFLGDAAAVLEAYRIDEMVPVGMNVREQIACNWKVVMDAFQEGYHVQAVHPELVQFMDMSRERFSPIGRHGATTVPFAADNNVEKIRALPAANFPGVAEIRPRFDELVEACRQTDGSLAFGEGISPRSLLQQAARERLIAKGLDVSGLTDNQLSDYQFWAFFPNVFLQLGAGEATVIIAEPDPDGDPNRCVWHAAAYLWLPPEQRAKQRTEVTEVPEGEHFPYFLALEQDYRQMELQQLGLRNLGLESLQLTKQEPRVAHLHAMLDQWLEGGA